MKAGLALLRRAGRSQLAVVAVVVLTVVAFAVGGEIKESKYAVLAEAPEKTREKKNPFAGDTQAVAAGGKLFEQHCAECHGAKAGGTRKGPSLLREEVQQATPGTLFWVMTNGVVRRGMPVWSKLPELERWQVVTFLQSLKLQAKNGQP
ncbi:MAG TPA: c-type cytochrome [Terriglobales bacterium]|nr:c-type cytochrome [Terriglobales bacterium]